MDSIRIVLGLGNPGARYECTRHNIGFWTLDRLAERLGARFRRDEGSGRVAWTAETRLGDAPLVLAKPRTYMNRSGRAAAALHRAYGVEATDFVVVCDDADLELGRLRIRPGGSSGGHNGLRSLIDWFGGGEFPRVKLGVSGEGRQEVELADYVLSPFDPEEQRRAERLARLGAEAVISVLERGMVVAMNRYNGRRIDEESLEA